MNTDTHNQNNEKIDYDFIVNQPSEPINNGPGKKSVVIIVLVVILIIVLLISLIVRANKKVQRIETDPQAPTTVQKAQLAAVKQFMDHALNNRPDDAFAVMDSTQKSISKDDFKTKAFPYLRSMKLKECIYNLKETEDNDSRELRPVVTCYTNSDNLRIDHEFEMSGATPPKIVNYRYIDPS